MSKFNSSLYFITDSTPYSEEEFLRRVEEALAGGATLLQLREKERTTREYLQLAARVHEIALKYQVPLIIDDRVDVALAVGAEGVHVGQSDLPVADARRLMGPDKIVGATTQIPAIGIPSRTSMLSLFNPPIALTAIGTASQIFRSVSVEVSIVLTFVVVG